MATPLRAAGSFVGRYTVALLFFGSLVSLMGLTQLGAQDPAGKQPGATKKDKDSLFDDAEIDESKAKPKRNGPPPVVDLAKAATDPKLHPLVRSLFAELATPHDVVNYRNDGSGKPFRQAGYSHIKPLAKYLADKPLTEAKLSIEEFQKDGEVKAFDVERGLIASIQPYEKAAVDQADKFLRRPASDFTPPLPRYNQAAAAEQALAAVLAWHESARSRGIRKGADWDKVLPGLRKEMLAVLLVELNELTDAKDWEAAFALAQRLSDNYPDEVELAGPFGRLLKLSLASPLDPSLRQRARQQLEQLAARYPDKTNITDLVKELKSQAKALLDQAKKLESSEDPKDAKEAQRLIAQALDVWPNLPDLRAYAGKVRTKYPVLRVGVRELPKYMSPALATTDSERRVVEFLFEGLVKFSPDAAGLGRYHLGLATGRPEVIALGRQFLLPDNAYWLDDEESQIKTADIVQTMAQLKKGLGNGLPAACGELYAESQPVTPAGPHRVGVRLNQGYLEPLSLMTFKVLPRPSVLPKALQNDEKAFAESPVGSGPFKFVPRPPKEGGREYLSFLANPNYGSRSNKLGLPRFREVRFFAYTDAKKEASAAPHFLDLLLDLTPDEAAALKDDGAKAGFRVLLPEANAQPPNRRVYFLAVNHRRPDLEKPQLRRALVRAINRENLLDKFFRGPLGKQVHKALNGPFPADCWANNPKVAGGVNKGSADPFDPDNKAKGAYASLTSDVRYKPPALSLKYPSNDPALEGAMKALKEQVEQTLPGVRINLEPVSPWALRDAVEKTHDFDLAYYHYDFPDDTYSLWPLFGGEENYFGYRDEQLTRPVRASVHFGDFEKVQDQARQAHLAFDLDAPLIPLWQLDPLMGVHDDVKTVPFDRHLIFTDIELWQFGKQRD